MGVLPFYRDNKEYVAHYARYYNFCSYPAPISPIIAGVISHIRHLLVDSITS